MKTALRANLLGALQILDGERDCTPSAPKPRNLLVLLLLRANLVVHVQALIEELWGPNPPASAETTLQTYIYQLRKLLADRVNASSQAVLITKSRGYLLRIDPLQLDVVLFERLVQEGRAALQAGDPECASRIFCRALALWNGPALADVAAGPLLRAHVIALEERRVVALESRIEADLLMGRHRELVGELKSLVEVHEYHEWMHAQPMLALFHSGRRAEALEAFHSFRRKLDEELGLQPSSDLNRLQRELLGTR